MVKFYAYMKCSTCVRAKKELDSLDVDYKLYDLKTENPDFDELKKIYQLSNLSINKLINSSGLVYKSMGLKDKIKTMSDDEILRLLATDGMLVKRPIILGDNFALIAYKEEDYIKKFKEK